MKSFTRLIVALLAGLFLVQAAAFAQAQVRGKVTDADGKPLAGVTVLVKGTTNGTMTAADVWACPRWSVPLTAALPSASP